MAEIGNARFDANTAQVVSPSLHTSPACESPETSSDDDGLLGRTDDAAGDASSKFPLSRADDDQPGAAIPCELGDPLPRGALQDLALGSDTGSSRSSNGSLEGSSGVGHLLGETLLVDGLAEVARWPTANMDEHDGCVELAAQSHCLVDSTLARLGAVDGRHDR